MTSASGLWMDFVLKNRQTVAVISMTSEFHDFFGSNFWRVLAIWNYCVMPQWGQIFSKKAKHYPFISITTLSTLRINKLFHQ